MELKVLLPNKNILSLYIKRNSNTDAVYQVGQKKTTDGNKMTQSKTDLHRDAFPFNLLVFELKMLIFYFIFFYLILQNIVKKLGMSTEAAQHFALFEIEEYNFGK